MRLARDLQFTYLEKGIYFMSTAFQPLHSRAAIWLPAFVLVGFLAISGYAASSPEVVESGECVPESLELVANLDGKNLQDDGTAALRIRVHGTDAPVELRLMNRTPGVVTLEGGSQQTAVTSGGDDNGIERTLYTHRGGDFDVRFELAENPCPAV